MKVSNTLPYANECMIGKPVRVGNKVVGKVVAVEGNNVISEIHDTETYNQIAEGKKSGYSILLHDPDNPSEGLYA